MSEKYLTNKLNSPGEEIFEKFMGGLNNPTIKIMLGGALLIATPLDLVNKFKEYLHKNFSKISNGVESVLYGAKLFGKSLPQTSTGYNNDTITTFNDIEKILDGISSLKNGELELNLLEIKDKILFLISNSSDSGLKVRNIIADEMNDLLGNKTNYSNSKNYLMNFGIEFQNLIELFQNTNQPYMAHKTLNYFIDNLNEKLDKFLNEQSLNTEEISIKKYLKKINENGDINKISEEVEIKLGHIGLVKFLEENIGEGIFLEEIRKICEEKMKAFDKNSLKYWNFNNIIVLSGVKGKIKQFEEKNNEEINKIRNFNISGGGINVIQSLGIIQSFLDSGGKLGTLIGSSMGAIISVFLAKGIAPSRIANDLKKSDILGANLTLEEDRKRIKEFFINLAKEYGIGEDDTFETLENPVLVNASRIYNGGEQEIYGGFNQNIIDFIITSTNINGDLFGKTKIDGIEMVDYATNQQAFISNPLKYLLDYDKMIALDFGYSSKNFPDFWKKFFTVAYRRDFLTKLKIMKEKGLVIDFEPIAGTVFENIDILFEKGEKIGKKYFEKNYNKKKIIIN